MGQEQSQERTEYVGVGYNLEQAGENLEMVLRATRDDTLRVGSRRVPYNQQERHELRRPILVRRELVVFRDGAPDRVVPVVHERNQINGLHIASVVL